MSTSSTAVVPVSQLVERLEQILTDLTETTRLLKTHVDNKTNNIDRSDKSPGDLVHDEYMNGKLITFGFAQPDNRRLFKILHSVSMRWIGAVGGEPPQILSSTAHVVMVCPWIPNDTHWMRTVLGSNKLYDERFRFWFMNQITETDSAPQGDLGRNTLFIINLQYTRPEQCRTLIPFLLHHNLLNASDLESRGCRVLFVWYARTDLHQSIQSKWESTLWSEVVLDSAKEFSDRYIGMEDMLNTGGCMNHPFGELSSPQTVSCLLKEVLIRFYVVPKIHIIRCRPDQVGAFQSEMRFASRDLNVLVTGRHDNLSYLHDLTFPPAIDTHHFIIITADIKPGDYIHVENVGLVYDMLESDTSEFGVVNSLVGHLCGHYEFPDPSLYVITSIDAVKKYVEHVKRGFRSQTQTPSQSEFKSDSGSEKNLTTIDRVFHLFDDEQPRLGVRICWSERAGKNVVRDLAIRVALKWCARGQTRAVAYINPNMDGNWMTEMQCQAWDAGLSRMSFYDAKVESHIGLMNRLGHEILFIFEESFENHKEWSEKIVPALEADSEFNQVRLHSAGNRVLFLSDVDFPCRAPNKLWGSMATVQHYS
jgi:hypothetical protein